MDVFCTFSGFSDIAGKVTNYAYRNVHSVLLVKHFKIIIESNSELI